MPWRMDVFLSVQPGGPAVLEKTHLLCRWFGKLVQTSCWFGFVWGLFKKYAHGVHYTTINTPQNHLITFFFPSMTSSSSRWGRRRKGKDNKLSAAARDKKKKKKKTQEVKIRWDLLRLTCVHRLLVFEAAWGPSKTKTTTKRRGHLRIKRARKLKKMNDSWNEGSGLTSSSSDDEIVMVAWPHESDHLCKAMLVSCF